MTAGLQIFNDSGTVLIDQNYHNLSLVKKGTHTLAGSPLVTTFYTGTQVRNSIAIIPALTSKAVVAVRSSSRVTAYLQGSELFLVGPTGASITYYIFDKPPPSTATYGLVVYTAAGEVAFDATRQYARVSGIRSGSSSGSWGGTIAYPSGRTYAVAFLLSALQYSTQCIVVGDPQAQENECYRAINYSGASVSGANVTFGMTGLYHYIYYPAVEQGAVTSINSMVAAVIDVTAY